MQSDMRGCRAQPKQPDCARSPGSQRNGIRQLAGRQRGLHRGLPGSNSPMSMRPPVEALHGSAGRSMRFRRRAGATLEAPQLAAALALRDGEVRFDEWQEKVSGRNVTSLRVAAAALRCSPEMSRRLQEVRYAQKDQLLPEEVATLGLGERLRPRDLR